MNSLRLFFHPCFTQFRQQIFGTTSIRGVSSIPKIISFPPDRIPPSSLQRANASHFSRINRTSSTTNKPLSFRAFSTASNEASAASNKINTYAKDCEAFNKSEQTKPSSSEKPPILEEEVRKRALETNGFSPNLFRYDRVKHSDPIFTKRLKFNGMSDIFIHNSLLIGVYDMKKDDKKGIFRLIAYNKITEDLVWQIPLTSSLLEENTDRTTKETADTSPKKTVNPTLETTLRCRLTQIGPSLSLQVVGEKYLFLINPETGAIKTLILPEVSNDIEDRLHIGPNEFAYCIVKKGRNKFLFGGKIINSEFEAIFKYQPPQGTFIACGTHCGFHDESTYTFVLVGTRGEQISIENCLAVQVYGNQLYTIEKDSINKDKCLLCIRTLKSNKEVVTSIETTIALNVKKATFGQFCQNGQLVLLLGDRFANSAIFINLQNQTAIYSQHSFSEYIINSRNGEIWTWDHMTSGLWKISDSKETSMGQLNGGLGTKFLHLDEQDLLYFIDNSVARP